MAKDFDLKFFKLFFYNAEKFIMTYSLSYFYCIWQLRMAVSRDEFLVQNLLNQAVRLHFILNKLVYFHFKI